MNNTRKNKVLLINPSIKLTTTSKRVLRFGPPYELLSIASYIEEKGYTCDIVNLAFEDLDLNEINPEEYLLIGFTVYIGDYLKMAVEISAELKQLFPSLPIVWGGPTPTAFKFEILETYENVDYVVRDEGEKTLFELCEYLNGNGEMDDIEGLSYRKDKKILHNTPRRLERNLDNYPVPMWELLKEHINKEQKPYYFGIISSKGCPFNCRYCWHNSEGHLDDNNLRWRGRSAQHVINEMEKINQLTGGTVFTFRDDNFMIKKSRALEILQYMKMRGFYAEQCVGHLKNFDDDIIDAMGGVVQTIIYAIESASPKLQKLFNKKVDIELVPVVNKKLFENGITTYHNFIIGAPSETDEDLRKNVELMINLKEINPYVRAVVYLFFPIPFTPLREYIVNDLGFELPVGVKSYEYYEDYFEAGLPGGEKHRPWLSKERYDFLTRFTTVFIDAFRIDNMALSSNSKELLEKDGKLNSLFEGIENINRPPRAEIPYVLDRILNGERIDLINDLKR